MTISISKIQKYSGVPYLAAQPVINGKRYLIHAASEAPPYTVWLNRDLLDQNGIPDLHDLQAQGKWNWDTFMDISIKMTRDFAWRRLQDLECRRTLRYIC